MDFQHVEDHQTPLESPPTFAELSGGDSRSEDSYWFEWQGNTAGSESSEAPSPELFANGYQHTDIYCDQQAYAAQMYYPEEAQYFNVDCSRTSPVADVPNDQRYYRWGGPECPQDVAEPNWNYSDCAYTNVPVQDCRDTFEMQEQTVNAFSALSYN